MFRRMEQRVSTNRCTFQILTVVVLGADTVLFKPSLVMPQDSPANTNGNIMPIVYHWGNQGREHQMFV